MKLLISFSLMLVESGLIILRNEKCKFKLASKNMKENDILVILVMLNAKTNLNYMK